MTSQKPKVLLVDDDEDMRIAVAAFLDDVDLLTLESARGLAGTIAREKPDVILLDVRLPGLDGTTAFSVLKKGGLLENSKIILFSSMDESDLSRWVRELGADGFVHKGRELPDLARQVRAWIFSS